MTKKIDEQLSAILAPLGVEVEASTPQRRHTCIVLVLGPPVASFELAFTRLLTIPLLQRASEKPGEEGKAALVDAEDLTPARRAVCERLGLLQEGVRISPISEALLRAAVSRRIDWCAYPSEGFVLAALAHAEVPVFFQQVGRETSLHARRVRYRQLKAARGFGRQFTRVLWEGEASGLLSALTNRWEVAGWLAGLCWICAEGILQWILAGGSTAVSDLNPRLMILAGEGKPADHVVVQVGPCYLDGDGVSTRRTLLTRHRTLEGLTRPRLLPYEEGVLTEQGFPHDGDASRQLALCLAQALGPFRPALLGLDQPS